MARNVCFDLEVGLESPADEEGVHDSFHQLIAEQSHNEDSFEGMSDDYELQQLPRDVQEEGEDNGALPSSPGHEAWRHMEFEEVENAEQVDPLIEERWSSATLRVLSLMPSRTIGRSRGAIISQYCNRTMKLRRRRQSRPSIRDFSHSARPSIRGYGVESNVVETDGSQRDHLVNNLQNLSVSDRIRMLRAMPLCVAEKQKIRMSVPYGNCCMAYSAIDICNGMRSALNKDRKSFSSSQIPCCSWMKYYIIIAMRHGWYSSLSFLHSLHLWQVALKRVSGRFGTGVLSYFLFLKTLLFFNLFLILVTGIFLVLPQAVHPPTLSHQKPVPFSGLELLTGGGYFSDSVMYYGYYSNDTLHNGCRGNQQHSLSVVNGAMCVLQGLSYNMPLAYFFTIGMAFFITCIILVYSMSKSFGQSFRIDKSHGILAMKVFCSWDFKVMKKSSVKLMSENISTQLKELLADVNCKDEKKSVLRKLGKLFIHCLAWSICVCSTIGCTIAIYFFLDYRHKVHEVRANETTTDPLLTEASLLTVPVVVSLINLLLPGLFNAAAWMEEFDSPSVHAYVAIGRNLMLKISILGVLCYYWLGKVAVNNDLRLQCWESFVGQELYRFLLMDFIFTILDTFFGEFLWRLFSEKVLKRSRRPVFDIARNVLELIYGQTLAWLGVMFTPLLPAVQIAKLLLLFYIKKGSLMMNCQAPRKPYRASQMTTVFITLLCFPSFLGVSVCVTYTMWSIKPSTSCGPFRELQTMFQAGKRWVVALGDDNHNMRWLTWIHTYLVENPHFLFVGAGIFLIVIYFHTQVLDGQRKIISLLQEQIENEGEDKKFLITRLQAIHEQKRTPPRRFTSRVCHSPS